MGNGDEPRGRRVSDRWSPPLHQIRSVPQIVTLDVALLALLLGTLSFVLPGTVRALYGVTDQLTPAHAGPGLLLLIAAAIALLSLVAGVVSISAGYPRIVRGESSRSGRFARRSLHAALLASALAIVQLAVFGLLLPAQIPG